MNQRPGAGLGAAVEGKPCDLAGEGGGHSRGGLPGLSGHLSQGAGGGDGGSSTEVSQKTFFPTSELCVWLILYNRNASGQANTCFYHGPSRIFVSWSCRWEDLEAVSCYRGRCREVVTCHRPVLSVLGLGQEAQGPDWAVPLH